MQVSFTSTTSAQDTFLLNNYLMSYVSDDRQTQWYSYIVVSKTAGFKWKYRVFKNFSQNKIQTGMVVGHGKHLHEQSGRREKGNKVQYLNKLINIALYFLCAPLLEFFPPRTSFFNSALMMSFPPSLPSTWINPTGWHHTTENISLPTLFPT